MNRKVLIFSVSAASVVSAAALSRGCSGSCLSCYACAPALIPLAIPAIAFAKVYYRKAGKNESKETDRQDF